MSWTAGPILYFRGATERSLDLDALLVVRDELPPPELWPEDGKPVAPELLHRHGTDRLWRYRFSVYRTDDGSSRYCIGDRCWPLALPEPRLRVAFTACNGDSANDFANLDTEARNERWQDLASLHAREPFHLLLQGGDQLYADDLWREVPALRDWLRLPRRARLAYLPDAATIAAVENFYFDRYCRLWSQSDIAPVLARIPSLMMWDDHDIMDGWGSHDPDLQACPLYQTVWRAARRHFALFQLGCGSDDLPAGFAEPGGGQFGWAYRVGATLVLAPDLRSQRTQRRVLAEDAREWLFASLADNSDCTHVLLVSTVPLINLDLSPVERLLRVLPGQQAHQDDLRDQWRSYAHRAEWRALVRRLLDWSERTGTPVTAVSGEIHLAAHGRIERGGVRLEQLISAGVAHDPPPGLLARLFDWWARGTEQVLPDTYLSMRPLPRIGRRYLARRGWLALQLEADGALLAEWRPQGLAEGLSWRDDRRSSRAAPPSPQQRP